jgi:hypothetical protein
MVFVQLVELRILWAQKKGEQDWRGWGWARRRLDQSKSRLVQSLWTGWQGCRSDLAFGVGYRLR